MGQVSFWVTHGAAVWQGVLAASAFAGLFVGYFLVDQAMRSRARRVREAIGKPAPAARPEDAGKRVTLSGSLVVAIPRGSEEAQPATGSPLAVTVFPQGLELSEETTLKAASAAARAAKLAIDVGGTIVAFDAPAQVLVGSRETERCVTRSAGQVLLWDFAAQLGALPGKPFGIRALATGDRVRVTGMLRHEPAYGGPDDYRSGAGAYSLDAEGVEAEERVLPLAFEGSPRPLARNPGLAVLRALAVPLGVVAALGAVGEIAVRVGKPWSSALATMTPFRRGDALAQLRAATPLAPQADAGLVERAIALDLLRGRCTDAVDDAFEHGSWDRSVALARRCGDPVREGRGAAMLADFGAAADAFARARAADPKIAPSLTEITAYVHAGRADAAAASLRALVPIWEGPASVRDRLECTASALEARAGNTEALEALRTKFTSSQSGICGTLLADLLHGPERAAVIATLRYTYWRGEHEVVDWMAVLWALSIEEAAPTSDFFVDASFTDMPMSVHVGTLSPAFDPRRGSFVLPPGLADAALRSLARSNGLRATSARARVAATLAMLDSFFGDVQSADLRLAPLKDDLEKAIHAHVTDAQRAEWTAHVELLQRERYETWNDEGAAALRESFAERRATRIRYDSVIDSLVRTAEGDEADVTRLRHAIAARGAAIATPATDGWDLDDRLMLDAIAGARARGDMSSIDVLARRDARELNRKLWDLVQAHDGPALVSRLEARGLDGRGVVENVGRAPGMTDALSAWVRWSYPTPCTTCGVYPLANYVASRRDASIAAHADEVSVPMQEVAARLRTLLLRRDIAIPLAVLSELSPP